CAAGGALCALLGHRRQSPGRFPGAFDLGFLLASLHGHLALDLRVVPHLCDGVRIHAAPRPGRNAPPAVRLSAGRAAVEPTSAPPRVATVEPARGRTRGHRVSGPGERCAPSVGRNRRTSRAGAEAEARALATALTVDACLWTVPTPARRAHVLVAYGCSGTAYSCGRAIRPLVEGSRRSDSE